MAGASAANGYTYRDRNGEVHVDGIKQIRDGLRKSGQDLSDLKKVMHDIGDIVAAEARTLVPVGNTGRLQRSIRSLNSASRAKAVAGDKRSAPYAGVINWGSGPHEGRPSGIAPTNFMQKAEENTKTQTYNALQDGIRDLMERNGLHF